MRHGTIAIVGRPNVGKSTLFNRIAGGRRAIVDDRPGVTRDRHFSRAEWAGHHFWLVDTGGWVSGQDDAISKGIRDQINTAITEADVIVLVVDTREGVHPADLEVAQMLRPLVDRVVVAANKADDLPHEIDHLAFHELGLGEPQPVSAASGKGSGDLLDRMVEKLGNGSQPAEPDGPSIAVIGRPNAGKSSLMNRLLGTERAIVAPEAGTTRDAIDSPLRYHGKTLNFIDTAGLRRRPKVKDDLEFYSALRAERAIERADICVLVVDAKIGVHAQDLRVANQAWEAGKGLIVAVNKWDLISEKDADTAERGRRELIERVPFLRHVPFLFVSALTGQRVRRVFDTILEVAAAREKRIPTAEVNRVLQALIDRNQPPQQAGREVKLLYASQIGTAPQTIALVTNRPEAVPESYVRFLLNGFYEAWGLVGSPIRIKLRRKRSKSR